MRVRTTRLSAVPGWASTFMLALLIGSHAARAEEPAQDRPLADFADPAAWTLTATDDVKAALRAVPGPHGAALCVDYDFGHVTGYVALKRPLAVDFPPRFELSLGLQGHALPNAFQFKLVDASAENVWWSNRPEFRFPADWRTLKIRQREIGFAWGPTADPVLRHSASVELVVASGSGAGQGSACFDRLTLRRLPDTETPLPAPRMDPEGSRVDFGGTREFSALEFHWHGASPGGYGIDYSDDGRHWQRMRHVDAARGERQVQWLPESETRYVRVVPDASAGPSVLDAIEPIAAADANALFTRLAGQVPRGRYPRAYSGEQSYWTVLGVDGAPVASLLSEDGVLEPTPGVGALEPFLVSEGRVLSWADARIGHSLREGDLPMPEVHWTVDGLSLDILAFGAGRPDAAQALARYTVRNLDSRPRSVTLALAWRPFQANPPTQFLAHPGGASAVESLAWDGRILSAGGLPRVVPLVVPNGVHLAPLAAGPAGEWL
ncbi:MAG: discoidin domain-containing protein, partial [Pseudomonadota bacterium]|nr:discoidin domain-containing protein [Pseudomonadota bacterium]